MLRDLFAGNIITDNKGSFYAYFRNLKDNPFRLIGFLAILFIPFAALAWWYYSFAMSIGAVMPLQSVDESSANLSSEPQETSGISDTSTPQDSTSSTSSERINVNVTGDSSQASVEIDGQSIPVPADGSTHQVIEDANGKTTIDIKVDSDTSGSSRNRSSTDINLRSSSSSDVEIKSKESR